MKYLSYMHIEKIGSSEVEGILQGTCYLFYKIDGTNSCVWLKDDGTLGFGSRKRELSLNNGKDGDNQGFMKSMVEDERYKDVKEDLHKYLIAHPRHIIYGEWLVPVNIKNYKDDAWRHFYVFDILDTETGCYLTYDDYSQVLNTTHIKYIPLLAKLENPTEDDIKALLDRTGEFLISSGLGEGIVIKNYNYVNRYGRRTWAKMLTEDFLSRKKDSRGQKREAQENGTSIERDIIKLMTVDHVIKEKTKVMENRQSDTWEMKFLPELLNRAFTEFWRDNWEIILKKFHNPTINFKVLKQYSDEFVKSIIL